MKRLIFIFLAAIMIPGAVYAADDPNIARETKDKVQIAMSAHINTLMAKNGGSYPIFDSDSGNVVQLQFLKLHTGVVVKGIKGKYFISCADFTDASGTKYDLDFLVSANYEVVEALVHKKNGIKQHYGVH